MDAELKAQLVETARSALARELQARGWGFDVGKAEMLRVLEEDLDHDGVEEICFVAGIPEYGGPALCGLCIPAGGGGFRTETLVPFAAGIRNFFISDMNKDGTPEVVTVWQEDFGLHLTLHVSQWDGSSVRSLFPPGRFHQGMMEMKDLDADGVDEILIWSGVYETDPRWGPQFFNVNVFRWNGRAYEPQSTHRSVYRYLPGPLLGQRIALTGLPEQFEHPPSPAERRRKLEEQKETGDVAPSFVAELGMQHSLLHREGFYDEALEIIALALEGVEYLTDPQAKVVLCYEACSANAFTHSWMGQWQEAIAAYRRAIDFYEQGASALVDAKFGPTRRRELGIMYTMAGDYGEALRWLSDAEAALDEAGLPEDKYLDELARIRSASGLAHVELGEYQLAKEAFSEAADLHTRLGRLPQAAISQTGLGNALRDEAQAKEGSYEEAVRAYEAALSGFRELSDRDRESDVYLELGRTLLLDGKPDVSLSFLTKALLLTSVPNLAHHAAVHYLYIGEAYAKLGDLRPAERFLEKAIELAERYATPETRWRALHQLALVRVDDGHRQKGVETLKNCIETIEQLRSQYLPESLKISLLSSKERPYEDLVALLCTSEAGGSGDADMRELEESFGYMERAKSRVFTEQLSRTDLSSAGLPAELLREEKDLILRLKALQARHRAVAEPQRYDWGGEVAEVEDRLQEIRQQIRQTGPRGVEYVSLREASPLGYTQIQALLGGGAAGAEASSTVGTEEEPAGRVVLAQYFTMGERTMLFIGRDDLEVPQLYEIDVNREDLWKWRNVFDDLDGEDLSSWDLDEWQNELGRLIEPITQWSEEGSTVWLVPHAEFHRLPLHALKVEDRYLIERNPVCYTPSASVMGYCKAKYTGRRDTALVLGDSLNDLPYAPEEARIVAELLGVEPYLGDQASKPLVKHSLDIASGAIDILHFACHGEYDWNTPLKSRIKLAPHKDARRSGEDGAEIPDLTAEEILDLDIKADLVTLSACESGVSDRRPGDELIGLTRSLIFAGTPSVVASLWRVNDRSTGVLMEHLYRGLLGSKRFSTSEPALAKAQALQAAQIQVMEAESFRHPYYWAAFILVGDWR